VHSTLFEIPERLGVARELLLIEGSGLFQCTGSMGRNALLLEIS